MAHQENIPFTPSGKSFTAVAINTAAKAGEWIKSKLGSHTTLSLKYSPQDLVTEVDKGSETMIRKLILTHFPTHSILGEEGVEPGPEASAKALTEMSGAEYLWIVDPIDGTTNFVHGFPFYTVSIALAYKGEVIVGVVYDPSRDELFVAEKGKGAYLRGKPMKVSGEAKLTDSLLATGFPADREGALPLNMAGLQHLAPKVRNVRIAGSAALHLAYVAAGRLSGFWEIGLNSWDTAAGALLVQESGGQVTDMEGNPYSLSIRDIAASNGTIQQDLLQELKAAATIGS
ncbi:inositol monophosphatase family protein [Paenibacillus aurantius]|uniref:Inositol-1-monophosphatase n=1 Tax=Paenibacillus aurantius TaxID=2918900 RepID=A0AA96LFB9_9BACL|nr:inositol monophosphatase family protein [Paenibacillus aurantius]WNQ12124.1 inositol monophosphatase family protein [Paenibacillus aurantius]